MLIVVLVGVVALCVRVGSNQLQLCGTLCVYIYEYVDMWACVRTAKKHEDNNQIQQQHMHVLAARQGTHYVGVGGSMAVAIEDGQSLICQRAAGMGSPAGKASYMKSLPAHLHTKYTYLCLLAFTPPQAGSCCCPVCVCVCV